MNKLEIFIITIFVFAFIVIVPFCIIWSLNTLFGMMLGYTLETWAAALFLWVLMTLRLTFR